MTDSKGGVGRRSSRGCLLLAACAAVASFEPLKLCFLAPDSKGRPTLRQRRDVQSNVFASVHRPTILRGLGPVLTPRLAGAAQEWTVEEERRVMDQVLGRVPPGSGETSSLAVEIRLVRQQTEELVKEIRLLRQSISAPGAPAQVAQSVKVAPPVAAPAPPRPAPVSSFPTPVAAPAPPRPAPVSSFPTPAPPMPEPAAPAVSTACRIVSAGWTDGNVADFYFNNRKVDIRGQADRRGFNVITIDPATQQVTSRKSYDVWGDPGTENKRLVADLNSLPDGRIVLMAMKDSGLENLDLSVLTALRSVGGSLRQDQLKMRESYALIGTKGGPALAEMQSGRVEIEGNIPCIVRHPPQLPPEPLPQAPQARPAAPQQFSAPTWAQPQAPAAPAPPPFSSFPTAASPAPSSFPAAAAPARSSFPTAAAPAPSSFPTAAKSSFPTASSTVRVPKLEVDPQGSVTYNDATVERQGSQEEAGQSWQEVVLMLDKLQEKIKAKRLAGV